MGKKTTVIANICKSTSMVYFRNKTATVCKTRLSLKEIAAGGLAVAVSTRLSLV